MTLSKNSASLFLLFLATLFTSCPHTQQLCLSISRAEVANLTVRIDEGFSCVKEPKITSIEIYKEGAYEQRWAVSAEPPTRIKEVTYGVIPKGFYLSLPAKSPLQSGEQIVVSIHGPGVVGGSLVTIK